jgi:hypothetical protein
MAGGKGGSSSTYETPKTLGFNPLLSRRLADPVLLTCGGENGPREASGDGAT